MATSTRSRAYRCPHKATQSPNTMSIWNFSRYWRRFLMGFPLGGLKMVAKEPMVDGRRPDFTRPALVAAVRCFWLRNCLQPKMQWRFRDSNWIQFSHGAGVYYGGIWGRLLASLWTRLRVQMGGGSTEFLWSVALLGSVGVILVKDWGRQSMFIEGGREACDDVGWLGCWFKSNRGWADWRCGHSFGICRFRFYVVDGTLIWGAKRPVADYVVIWVFHLEDEFRE